MWNTDAAVAVDLLVEIGNSSFVSYNDGIDVVGAFRSLGFSFGLTDSLSG